MSVRASKMAFRTIVIASCLVGLFVVGCGGASHAATSSQTSTESTAQDSAETPREFSAQKTRRYLTFGRVADAAEAKAAAAVVERYYRAVASNDGATACSLMYSSMAQATPETVGPLAGRHKSCATVMSLLFRTRHGMPTTDVAAIKVTQLRVKGDTAIALLRSPTMHSGEISMRRVGSRWTVLDRLGGVLPVPIL